MNYEKKYRDLVEAVKELQEANPSDDGIQNWVKENVPERKESEDERIRKEIINYFRCQSRDEPSRKDIHNKWIAWLEKQKDHEDELEKAYKTADEVQYRRGYEDAKREFEKHGEQKPVVSDGALREGITHFGITQYQIDNWLRKYVGVEKLEQKSSYYSCESDIDFKIEADKWYVCIKDYYYSDIDELMFTKGKAYKAYTGWGFISNNGTKKTPIGMFPYKEYFRPATDEEIPQEQKPAEWHREDEQNLNACLGFIPDEYLRRWLKDVIHVKYDKTVDKVEPKFKLEKGEWYVCTKSFALRGEIVVIKGQTYKSNQNGAIEGENKHLFIDTHDGKASDYFRHWNIADAKDGDVLVTDFEEDNMIVMYHSMCTKDTINVHCCLDNKIICSNLGVFDAEDVKPATKEQRDLLFQKLKEAGYEWDADKKELKKIEQKHAWSEEDERILNSIIEDVMPYGECPDCPSDKEREYFHEGGRKAEWLKSLKKRYIWKPSKEQMDALAEALGLAKSCGEECAFYIRTLHEQLKKLRCE